MMFLVIIFDMFLFKLLIMIDYDGEVVKYLVKVVGVDYEEYGL